MKPGDLARIVLTYETIELHKLMGDPEPWFNQKNIELLRETKHNFWEVKVLESNRATKFIFVNEKDFVVYRRKEI